MIGRKFREEVSASGAETVATGGVAVEIAVAVAEGGSAVGDGEGQLVDDSTVLDVEDHLGQLGAGAAAEPGEVDGQVVL